MAAALIGSVTELIGGEMELFLPTRVGFWFIQNQDGAPLIVDFISEQPQVFSKIVLQLAIDRGYPGGYLDSVAFPYFGRFLLTSTLADCHFGSGATPRLPANVYSYPLAEVAGSSG